MSNWWDLQLVPSSQVSEQLKGKDITLVGTNRKPIYRESPIGDDIKYYIYSDTGKLASNKDAIKYERYKDSNIDDLRNNAFDDNLSEEEKEENWQAYMRKIFPNLTASETLSDQRYLFQKHIDKQTKLAESDDFVHRGWGQGAWGKLYGTMGLGAAAATGLAFGGAAAWPYIGDAIMTGLELWGTYEGAKGLADKQFGFGKTLQYLGEGNYRNAGLNFLGNLADITMAAPGVGTTRKLIGDGVKIGNDYYSIGTKILGTPEGSTAIGFPIFTINKNVKQKRLLSELQTKYSKLPTQEDILSSLRKVEGAYEEPILDEHGFPLFTFGVDEGNMTVGKIVDWPLEEFGIDRPIIVKTDMTPPPIMDLATGEKTYREIPLAVKKQMIKAQAGLPSGTIFAPTTEIRPTKELMEQAIAHSNLEFKQKLEALSKLDSYNIPTFFDDGNLSIDSYKLMSDMGAKSSYRTHYNGDDMVAFNRLSANKNNPLAVFVQGRIGKRNGRLLDYEYLTDAKGNPIGKSLMSDYLRTNYPQFINIEEGSVPSFYIQKKLLGGKLKK